MSKLIGYARVSTRGLDLVRQQEDLLSAGMRRDDLHVNYAVSGVLV